MESKLTFEDLRKLNTYVQRLLQNHGYTKDPVQLEYFTQELTICLSTTDILSESIAHQELTQSNQALRLYSRYKN